MTELTAAGETDRRRPSRVALAALIVANLTPLIGVAAFGWSVRSLLLLYWAENVVVAVWAVARIIIAGGAAGVGLALFFCVHFGMFTAVHRFFVALLTAPGGPLGGDPAGFDGFGTPVHGVAAAAGGVPLLAALGLLISHGVSFFHNFLWGGEWRDADPRLEMAKPYPRMIALHVAIVLGAFVTILLGSAAGILVVLVLLKTALDAGLHLAGHRMRRAKSAGVG